MDEVRKERLMVAGIDVNGTLERFMGNEALLEQMLNKFKDDTHFQKLLEAAKQLNGDEGLSFSHTLKGMCGNLGMTELYELFDRQMRIFRGGDIADAFALLSEITPVYERMMEAICGVA